MISAEDLENARAVICASGPASSGDSLLGIEIDFCAYLGGPACADENRRLWRDMEVHSSHGTEWLITGHASGRSDSAEAIAAELSRVREEHLRYSYRAEHTVTSTPGYVRLRAVTRSGQAVSG